MLGISLDKVYETDSSGVSGNVIVKFIFIFSEYISIVEEYIYLIILPELSPEWNLNTKG